MITPRKHLGQNFLRDPNTIRKIVATLPAPTGTPIVEIGPGMGALTQLLLEKHPNLVAIEVDERAVAHLKTKYPNLDVRHMDVLKADWPALTTELGGKLHIIGNLPYNITSPILFSLLDAHAGLHQAVVMMQLEVAERLVAKPRTKAYGILSVQVQLYCRPTLCFRVPRNVFYPKPDVTSALVRLDFDIDPMVPASLDRELLRQVIRTAFNQRRKTLRNSLKAFTEQTGRPVPEMWAGKRAEELTPQDFVTLTGTFAGVDLRGRTA